MGNILIVAEIQNGKIREASYELAAFAQGLGGREVKSLVMGSGVAGEADALAAKGGGEVLLAENEALANYNVDAFSQVIRAAIDQAHVPHDAAVAQAREIAFFPPVTGG